jgi:primosomal protein N' (replication factor Y)
VGEARRSQREGGRGQPAEVTGRPGARDVPLAHLDRPFDYLVPRRWPSGVAAGRGSRSGSPARTSTGSSSRAPRVRPHRPARPLRRVVSAEPVLTPEVRGAGRRVAERYAGTRSDVLRLAVPPRHATAEKEPSPGRRPGRTTGRGAAAWAEHQPGPAFLRHLAAGGAPRPSGRPPPARTGRAARPRPRRDVRVGPGALLCVPDARTSPASTRADRRARDGPARRR